METQERDNSHVCKLMQTVRSNQVLGLLWSHQRGTEIVYELRITYVHVKPVKRFRDVPQGTLGDVLNVVTEACDWVDGKTGSSVSVILTTVNVV